jgi:hypothetical protein
MSPTNACTAPPAKCRSSVSGVPRLVRCGQSPVFRRSRGRELVRKVQADCVIEVDGNAYSVPWRLIGESVRVAITGEQLRISHAGREIAFVHAPASRLAPYPSDEMICWPVSARVGNVKNNDPSLIEPIAGFV